MARRLFTPVQANSTLPLVRRVVSDILERGRRLKESKERALTPVRADDQHLLEVEIRELIRELEQIGCSYKDWGFEKGLVDFPSKIGGDYVLLCWRSDESRVEWYHAPEAGYAGRTPIPAHLLEDAAEEHEASEC